MTEFFMEVDPQIQFLALLDRNSVKIRIISLLVGIDAMVTGS